MQARGVTAVPRIPYRISRYFCHSCRGR